jgi:DNA-directed RNA polymerase alpha subunit/DNA-directed RNA polymerase subunit L
MANAIRRIMLTEIPSIGINRKTVHFTHNTSMLNDDFLSHRLSMIPINPTVFDHSKLDAYEVRLNIKNDKDAMINILASHFEIVDRSTNQTIPLADTIPFPDILFAELKPTQDMGFVAKFKKGTPKTEGSTIAPVSVVAYHFKEDPDRLQKAIDNNASTIKTDEDKERFIMKHSERHFAVTKHGNPAAYSFIMESIGSLPAKEIMAIGFTVLIEKLNKFIENLNNAASLGEDASEKVISIQKAIFNIVAYDFFIKDENETLGNLIASFVYNNDEKLGENNIVNYIGYLIPHPLDNILVIRIGLKDSDSNANGAISATTTNTIEANKQLLITTANYVIKLLTKMKEQWIAAASASASTSKKVKMHDSTDTTTATASSAGKKTKIIKIKK